MNRDRFQKAARLLSREFDEEPYSKILQSLRAGVTPEQLRTQLTEQRQAADAELEGLKQDGTT